MKVRSLDKLIRKLQNNQGAATRSSQKVILADNAAIKGTSKSKFKREYDAHQQKVQLNKRNTPVDLFKTQNFAPGGLASLANKDNRPGSGLVVI